MSDSIWFWSQLQEVGWITKPIAGKWNVSQPIFKFMQPFTEITQPITKIMQLPGVESGVATQAAGVWVGVGVLNFRNLYNPISFRNSESVSTAMQHLSYSSQTSHLPHHWWRHLHKDEILYRHVNIPYKIFTSHQYSFHIFCSHGRQSKVGATSQ